MFKQFLQVSDYPWPENYYFIYIVILPWVTYISSIKTNGFLVYFFSTQILQLLRPNYFKIYLITTCVPFFYYLTVTIFRFFIVHCICNSKNPFRRETQYCSFSILSFNGPILHHDKIDRDNHDRFTHLETNILNTFWIQHTAHTSLLFVNILETEIKLRIL